MKKLIKFLNKEVFTLKQFIAIILIALLTLIGSCYCLAQTTIIQKDTVQIKMIELKLIEKQYKETGKTTTHFLYNNKQYNSDSTSINLFRSNKDGCNAYIIYNCYSNNEKKVSKILILKKDE